jgi:23S rRNA (guanine2445-N2)-methyltransferase / 23S rRNA (guanine2069-N7)-methyltransferase
MAVGLARSILRAVAIRDTHPLELLATSPRDLGRLLADELRQLGAGEVRATSAGARFQGDLQLAYRICLWSRLAGRLLLRLLEVEIETADDLYRAVHELDWPAHLRPEGTISVDAAVSRLPPGVRSSAFLGLRVKDAVVDRMREATGRRPSVQRDRPDLRLHLRVADRRARLYLDLSGESLHRRGYRERGGEAPLKENLAAGLLVLAGWPAAAEAGLPLLDPMCGSGTLPIEAALLAADRAPGLGREHFGFLGWRGHRAALWASLLEQARQRAEAGARRTLPLIAGCDADPRAVAFARRNLERAGLAGRVRLEVRALADAEPPAATPGLLVCNPPYGERLGDEQTLRPLYTSLGDLLKRRFAGWRAFVLSGGPELTRYLGLRASHQWSVWNGPIACRLLEYPISDGAREVPPEAASESPSSGGGAPAFANRLRKNVRHLGRWARRQGISCYRLYDADLPEYAVAVDRYEDAAVVSEYAPPSSVDADAARRRLRQVLSLVPEVLGLSPGAVHLKVRRRQTRGQRYAAIGSTGELHEVGEGGHRFLVNFDDHLDTGLFLDHRQTRALLAELASGRRFLNLFCYTGTATVYAARGGASGTVSVDLSSTYLDWARRNLELNGVRGPRHQLVRADAVEWLRGSRERFGLIFCDPPTFSNSKAMRGTLDVLRDHAALIQSAVQLLAPGGLLLFSTNAHRFRLAPAEELAGLSVEEITKQTLPLDFARSPRVHHLYRISNQREGK